jgi:hypothetical protein
MVFAGVDLMPKDDFEPVVVCVDLGLVSNPAGAKLQTV